MRNFGLEAPARRTQRGLGETEQMQSKTRHSMPAAMLIAAGLAGLAACSHPAPVAMAPPPPPPPVGHEYQVLVQVPPPVRHIRVTPLQQQEVQQAFNVIALKSALMVGALSCSQQDQYDQFMTTFQPHILAEQHVMDQYFRRGSGYYGQAREDDFVTLLANNQSVGGIGQGAIFCLNNSAEFKAVLALRTPSDLDNFVTDLAPDAPVVVAARPTVSPLAPGDSTVHVAVIHASRHVHLVQTHSRKHWYAVTHTTRPAVAAASAENVAAAAPAAKRLSLAAAVPQ
jgi:hypothetical protein